VTTTTTLPTASRLYLARECPPAFALPHLDVPTEAAELGKARHAERDAQIEAGQIPEVLAKRWPGYAWRSELAYAYDYATGRGRILGRGLNRDYSSASPTEICGTADAVGYREHAPVVVIDWKGFEEVECAATNVQLHFGALALTRAIGTDEAEVAIHYEARPVDVASIDAFDLEAFAADILTIIEGIIAARARARMGHELAYKEGEHCKYCPAFHACPRKRHLAVELNAKVEQSQAGKMLFAFDDDVEAARAYEFAARIAQFLGNLRAALAMRAKERPIPLGNGRLYGPVEKPGNEKLDGDIVYNLVKEKYGQGIADAAVLRSATKKRLAEALEFAGVANKAGAERDLLKAIRDRGGAKREIKTALDEYDAPNKQLLDEVP